MQICWHFLYILALFLSQMACSKQAIEKQQRTTGSEDSGILSAEAQQPPAPSEQSKRSESEKADVKKSTDNGSTIYIPNVIESEKIKVGEGASVARDTTGAYLIELPEGTEEAAEPVVVYATEEIPDISPELLKLAIPLKGEFANTPKEQLGVVYHVELADGSREVGFIAPDALMVIESFALTNSKTIKFNLKGFGHYNLVRLPAIMNNWQVSRSVATEEHVAAPADIPYNPFSTEESEDSVSYTTSSENDSNLTNQNSSNANTGNTSSSSPAFPRITSSPSESQGVEQLSSAFLTLGTFRNWLVTSESFVEIPVHSAERRYAPLTGYANSDLSIIHYQTFDVRVEISPDKSGIRLVSSEWEPGIMTFVISISDGETNRRFEETIYIGDSFDRLTKDTAINRNWSNGSKILLLEAGETYETNGIELDSMNMGIVCVDEDLMPAKWCTLKGPEESRPVFKAMNSSSIFLSGIKTDFSEDATLKAYTSRVHITDSLFLSQVKHIGVIYASNATTFTLRRTRINHTKAEIESLQLDGEFQMGRVDISHCDFRFNGDTEKPVILANSYPEGASLSISHSTFAIERVENSGAAIWNLASAPILVRNSIFENISDDFTDSAAFNPSEIDDSQNFITRFAGGIDNQVLFFSDGESKPTGLNLAFYEDEMRVNAPAISLRSMSGKHHIGSKVTVGAYNVSARHGAGAGEDDGNTTGQSAL